MSQVKSFEATLAEVRKQLEPSGFPSRERAQAEELCLIVAEIYSLPRELTVKIDGRELPCGIVAEVYSRLRAEHVSAVIEKFSELTYRVRYKKTYLRTALYNEVFEHMGGLANDVADKLF